MAKGIETQLNIVIITSFDRGFASNCIPELLKQATNYKILAVIVCFSQPQKLSKRLKRIRKKVAKIGVLGALNGIRMRKWFRDDVNERLQTVSLKELCVSLDLPLIYTKGVNSQDTQEYLKELNPDLGLSLGNGFISSRIFNIPKYGMLNVHHEVLPDYQGAQSIIWPLFFQEKITGYTIHRIEKEIDTGAIVYQEKFPIEIKSKLRQTVSSNYAISKQKSIKGLVYTLNHFRELLMKSQPQTGGNRFTTPSITEFLRILRNHKRLLKRQVSISEK